MTASLTRDLGATTPDRPIVVDNAAYAWSNTTQACLAALHDDFVSDYRAQLDRAAAEAIVPFLIAAWAQIDYEVRFGTTDEVDRSDRAVPNETYWAVWERAADALDAHDLVAAAELNDELNGYREAAA